MGVNVPVVCSGTNVPFAAVAHISLLTVHGFKSHKLHAQAVCGFLLPVCSSFQPSRSRTLHSQLSKYLLCVEYSLARYCSLGVIQTL
jgi:hypothetical protein